MEIFKFVTENFTLLHTPKNEVRKTNLKNKCEKTNLKKEHLQHTQRNIYIFQDTVKGHIIIQNKLPLSHLGVHIQVEGTASLTLSSKSVGRIESIYNTTKSLSLIFHSIDVLKAGK